ncbi:MAG TPA: zinc ribbon domain-containing protein [Nitrospiria bacterium]
MPLYEYACRDCTKKFVLLQPVSVQPGETVCPDCGTQNIQRLFSPFASKTEAPAETFESGGGSHGCGSGGCGCA